MHLVQIFLPLRDNAGRPFPAALWRQVRDELLERFGGLTAHARAPATGLWQDEDKDTVRDDIVIHEVMTDTLDEAWWRDYRRELERRFAQEAIVVRVQDVRLL